MPFSCRERAAQALVKKRTISRAKRSAATAGWGAYWNRIDNRKIRHYNEPNALRIC
jgi:hypothetical protein